MSPNNRLMVACGDTIVVVDAHNTAAASDVVATVGVVATDDVVVVVGAAAVVVVWVQWCLMRPCTSLQFAFVLVVVTLKGEELSWWDL